jgi:hydroxyacylglutathione hydrolase
MAQSNKVIKINLPLANAFLVRGGAQWIVVDTGAPGDADALLRAASRHGITPRDIGLILLTHGHVDHFGGAAELRERTGAPIAVHAADLPFLESGRNPDLAPTGLEGRIFRPFLPWVAKPLTPDITFSEAFDLRPYGLDTRTIHTPGHSPGHIALPLPGGELIAGDLLRGGFIGGRVLANLPNLPFYVADPAQLQASIKQVLDLGIHTLYVGHGGPLNVVHVRQRLAAGALSLASLQPA